MWIPTQRFSCFLLFGVGFWSNMEIVMWIWKTKILMNPFVLVYNTEIACLGASNPRPLFFLVPCSVCCRCWWAPLCCPAQHSGASRQQFQDDNTTIMKWQCNKQIALQFIPVNKVMWSVMKTSEIVGPERKAIMWDWIPSKIRKLGFRSGPTVS